MTDVFLVTARHAFSYHVPSSAYTDHFTRLIHCPRAAQCECPYQVAQAQAIYMRTFVEAYRCDRFRKTRRQSPDTVRIHVIGPVTTRTSMQGLRLICLCEGWIEAKELGVAFDEHTVQHKMEGWMRDSLLINLTGTANVVLQGVGRACVDADTASDVG